MLIIFIFLLKCLFKQHDVCVQLMTYKISVLLINEDTFEKHFSSFFSYRFQRRRDLHNPHVCEIVHICAGFACWVLFKCHL